MRLLLEKIRLRILLKLFNLNRSNRIKETLVKEGKTKWLDLGCSGVFEENFYYADINPSESVPEEFSTRYFDWNATTPINDDRLKSMGTFDLIRMQHVFEHFTIEEAKIVLENCNKLLNPGGFLLISVPDLQEFIKRYRRGSLHLEWPFKNWAESRIQKSSPQSFYFSIFTHSLPHQKHEWCYDVEGLKYIINKSGHFHSIKRIRLWNKEFNIPFTHNRPLEDLTVLCQKKF